LLLERETARIAFLGTDFFAHPFRLPWPKVWCRRAECVLKEWPKPLAAIIPNPSVQLMPVSITIAALCRRRAMSRKKTPFNFEVALAELEGLVDAMEEGELSLEDSLKAFEKGVKLTRECQQALTQAEQKVQILMQEGAVPEAEPYALDTDDEDDDESEDGEALN
jgi:exodeoxyribonuclease VII small subunit